MKTISVKSPVFADQFQARVCSPSQGLRGQIAERAHHDRVRQQHVYSHMIGMAIIETGRVDEVWLLLREKASRASAGSERFSSERD